MESWESLSVNWTLNRSLHCSDSTHFTLQRLKYIVQCSHTQTLCFTKSWSFLTPKIGKVSPKSFLSSPKIKKNLFILRFQFKGKVRVKAGWACLNVPVRPLCTLRPGRYSKLQQRRKFFAWGILKIEENRHKGGKESSLSNQHFL